jgi:hypothetical protein
MEVGSTRGLTTDRITEGTRRLVDEECDEGGVKVEMGRERERGRHTQTEQRAGVSPRRWWRRRRDFLIVVGSEY